MKANIFSPVIFFVCQNKVGNFKQKCATLTNFDGTFKIEYFEGMGWWKHFLNFFNSKYPSVMWVWIFSKMKPNSKKHNYSVYQKVIFE